MNKIKTPFISVITATYNAENFLPIAIKSMRNQAYRNFEWIIIDGASSDRTIKLIKNSSDVITHWISEPDKGIYEAWNKGILLSRGEWIAFLGADDIYLPNGLTEYASFILKNKNIEFDYISSRVNFVTKNNRYIRTVGSKWIWNKFKYRMNIAHVGSLHNKNLFKKIGLFDTNFKICADYELLLRSKNSLKAGFIESITAEMTIGGVSDSFEAIKESMKAKIQGGNRSYVICLIEKQWAMAKCFLRKLLWY